MRCLDGIADSVDMSLSKPREIAEDRGAWRAAVRGVTRSRTRLSHWTTTGRQRKTISPAASPALTAAARGPLGFSC